MNPSQSSFGSKRNMKIPDYLGQQMLPQTRNFEVINEYGSAPFKNEASLPIKYPHIKERIIKFKNSQIKRTSLGEKEKKRTNNEKEFQMCNIYT